MDQVINNLERIQQEQEKNNSTNKNKYQPTKFPTGIMIGGGIVLMMVLGIWVMIRIKKRKTRKTS